MMSSIGTCQGGPSELSLLRLLHTSSWQESTLAFSDAGMLVTRTRWKRPKPRIKILRMELDVTSMMDL
eukprot:symbB.v1.2.023307.t1/scaffold2122.1/size88593/6